MGRQMCRWRCCTVNGCLITVAALQMVSSVERQVFDFLGQMWAPILFNFISTLFTLVGLFGAYYHRTHHLVFYSIWQIVSLAWNIFLMAFYLELGPLSRTHDSSYINLGTGSVSWWASNGPNCEPQYNLTQPVAVLPGGYYEVTPISVEGCIIPYYVIETLQAAVHLVLTIFALILSLITLTSLCCKKPDIQRQGPSANVAHSHPVHYDTMMGYHVTDHHHQRSDLRTDDRARILGSSSSSNHHLNRPNGQFNTLSSRYSTARRSMGSLPNSSRRSMSKGRNSRHRSSTRSTASARRKRRLRQLEEEAAAARGGIEQNPCGYSSRTYDTDNYSVYNTRSDHGLINSHYDVSSLDSFSPGGGPHINPMYNGTAGSVTSAGSRFSLYTINPHSTLERITVDNCTSTHHSRRNRLNRSPIYMNSTETVM